MRGVNADVNQRIGILHIQLDGLGEGVLLAVLLHHGSDGHGGDTGLVGRPLEGDVQGAAGSDGVAGLVDADGDAAADGVAQGLDGGVGALAVKEGGGQGQLLARNGGGGAADQVGDAQLQALAHPHGGGDSQVAVFLSDADEVVAVIRGQGDGESAVLQLGGIAPGVGHLAGVDYYFHLSDGIGGIGIVNADLDVQLLGNRRDVGAHHLTVDGVAQLQVLILGGVHTHGADGLVDALLGKVIGEDNVAGIVGVAPLALVVILVVGGGQVPALIQGHDVLLIAGIVAAGADLAFAVTDLHHVHAAVDDGVPIAEILEVAEGGAGVVELADGVGALRLAQQGVVGLHACVVGLVVQGSVVAGDHAGGVEGVDMAGTAGPGHFEAAQGHHVAGVFVVELGDGVLVGLPAVVGIGILDQGGVIEGALHIGTIFGIEIVGVVGEGHELDVGAVGDVLDIVQRGGQSTGAVGILGVAVELAEVELIGGLAHGEEPAEFGSLAVGTGGSDLDVDAAVSHVGGGGVGDAAVLVCCSHSLAVHGHGDGGGVAGVGQSHGDSGLFVVPGLGGLGGLGIGEDGLIFDGDHSGAGDGCALGILAADGDGERVARHEGRGDGDGVGAVLTLGDGESGAVQRGGHVTLHAEGGVHGEGQLIVLSHIGRGHGAEVNGGRVHNAVHSLGALRHGVEGEGVDGVVQLAGGAIHAIDLEAVTEILQPLAVALVFGGAALHLVAAHAAGAGADQPIGVVTGGGAIESVVAGAVCAEVAVGVVAEAVVVAVFLHGEHHGAVGADSLAILNGGGRLVDGGAAFVIVLRGQNSLGVLVVDDHLAAHGEGTGGGGRLGVGAAVIHYQVELLGKQGLIADPAVAAPVTLVGIPLQVISADIVLNIEAVSGFGVFNGPGGVRLIQRRAAIARIHGQLLAIGGGEGVGAVGVDAHGPDVRLGVTGELAVCNGHIGALVIEAAVLAGQSLAISGVEDDHCIAIGQAGDDAALPDLEESLSEQGLIADPAVAAPVALVGIPLQVVAPDGIFNIVAAVSGSLLNGPGGVHLIQRCAAIARIHGELLAIGGGEGVGAVGVDAHGPDVRLGVTGELAVCNGHIGALVIEAAVLAGQSLAISGVVDDHLVAVLKEGGGLRLRVGGLAAGVDHQVDLLLEGIARAGVGAPGALGSIPLEAVFVGAGGVVDVEGGILAVHGADLPAVVDLAHGGAGVAGVHGELLVVGVCKAVSAVVIDTHGPLVHIGKAIKLAFRKGHISALVIEAAVLGGQGLFVNGVKDHDRVAILQGGQVRDDAALAGGRSIQLPKTQGFAGNVGVNGSVAAPILTIVYAYITFLIDVIQIAGIRVHLPIAAVACSLANAVVGRGGIQVFVGFSGNDLEGIAAFDDLPAELGFAGGGQRVAADSAGNSRGGTFCITIVGQYPGGRALGHGDGDCIVRRNIGQGNLFPCAGRRIRRKHCCGQQRQQHHQRQQHGYQPPAMSSLLQNLIPPVHFARWSAPGAGAPRAVSALTVTAQ